MPARNLNSTRRLYNHPVKSSTQYKRRHYNTKMGQQNILLGTAILWLGLGLGVNGGLLDDLFPTASADIAKEAAMTTVCVVLVLVLGLSN